MFLSKSTERELGEILSESKKTDYKGKILPTIHPESIRLRAIANYILKALRLRHERVRNKSLEMSFNRLTRRRGSMKTSGSRRRGRRFSNFSPTRRRSHLEVIVVAEPIPHALTYAGGKIVLFRIA